MTAVRSFPSILSAIAGLVLFAVCAAGRAADPSDDARAVRRPPHLLCILIGGMDSDPTPEQLDGTARRDQGNSGLYRLRGDLLVDRVQPEYFNWNGTRGGELKTPDPPRAAGIVQFLQEHSRRHPSDRIVVVGNSWGGHTAFEVARDLVAGETPLALDLVVFLDPSSAGRSLKTPKMRPININRSVNYYTRNRFVWGALPFPSEHENIDLGDQRHGFLIEPGPKYQSAFDFPAHVAAEWDEKIHADVRRRILELRPAPR